MRLRGVYRSRGDSGRLHFAQGKFSAATYVWETDVAALKVTKGSPVTVQDTGVQWGVGAGRIVSLTPGGPTGVATLVLDAEIETDPAAPYRMQIRGPSGKQAVNCTPHSPCSATFYLHSMPAGLQACRRETWASWATPASSSRCC